MELPRQGILSPPNPLPNPSDLGMGRYTNRFNVLNMLDPICVKQWSQVIAWFKLKGAPIANEVFFTAFTELSDSSYAPTAVLLINPNGDFVAFDATMCYNFPDAHLQQLEMSFKFGNPNQVDGFPGFDVIDESKSDPVGSPIPAKNTPGWTREFPRYSDVNSNYQPSRHVVGYRFERLNGELYEMNNLPGAPLGPGPFSGFANLPVWQRLR